MEILQIVAVGMIGTILSVALKKESGQFSLFIGLVTGIVIFFFLVDYLERVISILSQMTENTGINRGYFNIIIKIIGISYIAKFAAELSKDAGEGAISTKIDLAGKILIAVSAIPIIMALIEMMNNFI